jgi:uncharacterized membrane protein SirB2
MIAYNTLKFIHVSAVVLWVGGLVALSILNARLGRAGDRQVLAATARETAFFGRVVIAPSIGVVLFAGIAMVAVGHVPPRSAWIVWGLLGIVAFVLVGAIFTGRAGAQLSQLAAAERSDAARIAALQRRLSALTALNVLILFSTIWAMVFKPTF